MNISQIIAQLRAAQIRHGDLPVTGNHGFISELILTPCEDGVSSFPDKAVTPNEIHMETLEND